MRLTVALAACAVAMAIEPQAGAATAAATFGPRSLPRLDPFRKVSLQNPSPATTPPAAPVACTRDDQCPDQTICEQGTCRPFERPFNVLIYRHEGPFTAVIPFYFSRRGSPGYRVVLPPFYWHFWGPESKTHIVAPFYWRFEDYLKQRVVTVVVPLLPYSHTKEPGAESWAVWPIFYVSTKFGWMAPLLLSFKLGNPDTGKAYGLYALLYFWKRDHKTGSAFDFGFPLFVSSRSPESTFTWAFPLNFYWRHGKESNLLLFPLSYQNMRPHGRTLVSPLGYASVDGRNGKGSAFWLYWFGRDQESSYDVLFPLLWSFRGATSSTTLAVPFFFHARRGSWSLTGAPILPLFFSARDEAAGSAWKLAIPVFFWTSSDHGRKASLITPLGGYSRDDDAGTHTLAFLLLFRRHDPQSEWDVLFPVFWRHRDLALDTTTRFIGNVYLRDDPAGTTRVFFPLFWHFRDAATGATAHSFFPLYFRRSSPTETTTAVGVLPIAWFFHRRYADQGWSAGLWPVAFFGRRGPERHAMVLPVFFHFKDQRSSSTVALPLYYHRWKPHESSTGILPLLYFQGQNGPTAYRIQFPLLWHFSDAQKQTATTVVGPFYFQRAKDRWSSGLVPFLWSAGGASRSHFVLFPIFWRFHDAEKDRTTTVVLNYLHRRQGEEVTDAFFPLLHYRRGSATDTSFTLFPLVHYHRDATTTVFASPLAAWARGPERKAGVVIPYFWYQSRTIAAQGVPLLYLDVTHLPTGQRTRAFGPWIAVDAPGKSARVLFPVFGRYREPGDTGTYVFPTFFHRRTDDGYALDTFLPVFWHSRWPGHSTTVVGPWFNHRSPEGTTAGFVPLFVRAQSPERSLLVTPIFYRYANFPANTTSLWAGVLFYRSTNPEGGRTVLFPFWFARDRGPAHHRVFFPVFWHFANTEQDSSTNLFLLFYWSRHGTHRTRGLMPLAWYSRDEAKATRSNALLPIFYEKRAGDQQTFVTPLFGFRSAPDHHWWYVLNVFSRDAPETSFAMVAPLWFSHFDKVTETRTRLIPPLLNFTRSSPDRSLSGWAGLFWRHQTLTSSKIFILPLFYDVHSFHESRTTILLPLFLRHRRDADDTTITMAAPIFYRRTSATDSSTVVFPFLWDFASAERRSTLVLPLFARFRRPTWTATFVVPSIYYRSGTGADEGTYRLFVFPLWESAVKRPGDFMWEAILGLVGFERIGRNRFLKLLFFPFELEAAPQAQTAWYGRAPQRPRSLRAQGVNTQVW